jgi:IS5 family transposase
LGFPDDWKNKPAKLRQKDRDARWTVKFTKAEPREDGSSPMVDLAIPVFGYQNHISIDCGFGFIRQWSATDAAYEGRRLREGLLDKTKYGEQRMGGCPSQKAKGARHARRDPARQREIENPLHVFAEQKDRMGLFIRTIGIATAKKKIGLANFVYNIKRLLFLRRIAVA